MYSKDAEKHLDYPEIGFACVKPIICAVFAYNVKIKHNMLLVLGFLIY